MKTDFFGTELVYQKYDGKSISFHVGAHQAYLLTWNVKTDAQSGGKYAEK